MKKNFFKLINTGNQVQIMIYMLLKILPFLVERGILSSLTHTNVL